MEPKHPNDPRYAETVTMYAILHENNVEAIAETPELAETYVGSRWSDEFYSIEPITVIRSLPEPRTLYILTGRLPSQPDREHKRELDERTEFPGLFDGAIVPLDGQVDSGLLENPPYGWDVSAIGWDLQQVEAAFEERMDEAQQLRAARIEAFSRFTPGCAVRTNDGETLIRSTTAAGVPCWQASSRVLYDANVDPGTLTLIAP